MEKNNSFFKAAVTNGVILGLALIVYSVLMYILGLNLKSFAGWLSYLVIILILVYTTKAYREKYMNNVMTYGQALGFGMLIITVGSLIYIIYNYIFITIIDPGYLDKVLAVAEEKMLERGMPDEQVEMALSMQKKMMNPIMTSVWGFVGSVFFGFIITLITSIFLKKEGDSFESTMQNVEE